MQSRGFLSSFVEQIKSANPNYIGTKLGNYMIDKNVSASDMAKRLGISKATVYYICQSKFRPRPELQEKIEALLNQN
jgi:transcriptional regulator with XRE-family HTH domain